MRHPIFVLQRINVTLKSSTVMQPDLLRMAIIISPLCLNLNYLQSLELNIIGESSPTCTSISIVQCDQSRFHTISWFTPHLTLCGINSFNSSSQQCLQVVSVSTMELSANSSFKLSCLLVQKCFVMLLTFLDNHRHLLSIFCSAHCFSSLLY